MPKLQFKALMKIREGNPYVLVSRTRATELKPDWRKPMPVLVQINGQPQPPWQINMMPVGDGSFYLYLHGDVRMASNTKVGDRVVVDLSFNEGYHSGPMHPMPPWFRAALNKNTTAKKNWQKLIPSRQKEILRYLSWLKSPEAQQRNLERAMRVLGGKPERFMARSWNKGT
jgi:hypothetical protein